MNLRFIQLHAIPVHIPVSYTHLNGIPRVLDAGQCNDSYSLAVIALKLKEVFGLHDINELPINSYRYIVLHLKHAECH